MDPVTIDYKVGDRVMYQQVYGNANLTEGVIVAISPQATAIQVLQGQWSYWVAADAIVDVVPS